MKLRQIINIEKWKESIPTSKHWQDFILLIIVLIFIALLWRNPFSTRTIIPDLYPYPDSIYYINPARSLLAGEGFQVTRQGRSIPLDVPPLYSLYFLPFFVLYNDPRIFYIANVVLSFISFGFLYKILQKLNINRWTILFILWLYCTNLLLNWYPMLAMAENLILPLFLIGIYLLIEKVSFKKAFLAGIISISFYATKYAAAPMTTAYVFLYGLKMIYQLKNRVKIAKTVVYFIIGALLIFLPFEIFEYISKERSLMINVFNFILDLFSLSQKNAFAPDAPMRFFSLSYFGKQFPRYIKTLLEYRNELLDNEFPIILPFIAIGAWIGIFWSLLVARLRFISFSILTMLLLSVLFLSTFYYFDFRYILFSIVALLIGFALLLDLLYLRLKQLRNEKYFIIGVFGLFLIYIFSAPIYFYYTEEPAREYVGVGKLNAYFTQERSEKKPIVITLLPPYFVDFYSNGNYELLPLSPVQNFVEHQAEIVWGHNDYSDLTALYSSYLAKGYDIYVQKSGLNYIKRLDRGYQRLKKDFAMELVFEGCKGDCNLYRIYKKRSELTQ